jgi:hypothetical protein
LAADLLLSGVYVSNAVSFITVLLPAHEILEKLLSYVASAIQHTIKGLGRRDQEGLRYHVAHVLR